MSNGEANRLFERLRSAKRLPSPPGTALKVLDLCRADDVGIHEITDTILPDPALSGRLLKYANSPLAGLSRSITSIQEAVALLGIRTVKMTALGFSLATMSAKSTCKGFKLQAFWTESYLRAVIARHITPMISVSDREEAFTAALLSGIGQLVLASGVPSEYGSVLASKKNESLFDCERRLLGSDSAAIGALLLESWGLPEELVVAVRRQAEPIPPNQPRNARAPLSGIVCSASILTPVFHDHNGCDQAARDAAIGVVENSLGLEKSTWDPVAEQILEDFRRLAEVFDVQLDGETSVLDIYAEAQEEAMRVGMVTQMEQSKTLVDNAKLLKQAMTDPLTGIANRARFDERLDELLNGIQRGHGDFSLIMIDIDYFKKFNDEHGHQIGDLVLKRVATSVKNWLRDVDMAARYGGEEFTILAPQTVGRDACLLAARVRKLVSELEVDTPNGRLSINVSLGVACTGDYPAPPTAEQLIADADVELYRSKRAGRNTWSYRGKSASLVNGQTAIAARA